MTGNARKWDDLKTRVLTGICLALVAAFAVWAGAGWFLALVILAAGLMIWELARIVDMGSGPVPVMFALAAGLVVCVSTLLQGADFIWAALLVIAVFGFAASRLRYAGTLYAGAILMTALLLVSLRAGSGPIWLIWLVLVVIANDIAGYLVGRAFGGPKFWPKISPKKTWTGTVAGWIAAAVVGAIMAQILGVGFGLIWISAVLAFTGQLGDIAESALKRQAGIKDSSNMLPGHGGVLDRLDALIGASVGLLIIQTFLGLPG